MAPRKDDQVYSRLLNQLRSRFNGNIRSIINEAISKTDRLVPEVERHKYQKDKAESLAKLVDALVGKYDIAVKTFKMDPAEKEYLADRYGSVIDAGTHPNKCEDLFIISRMQRHPLYNRRGTFIYLEPLTREWEIACELYDQALSMNQVQQKRNVAAEYLRSTRQLRIEVL